MTETLEEVAEKYADIHMEKFDLTNTNHLPYFYNDRNKIEAAFESGAKWQTERMYSEEEINKAYNDAYYKGYNIGQKDSKTHSLTLTIADNIHKDKKKWFEQLKKTIK